jgi:TatD DNase family protein
LALIFDTHAHYDDLAFDADRDAVICSLKSQKVCAVVNAASDIESSRAGIALAEKYPFIWAAAGIHPHEVGKAPANALEILEELLYHPRVVALGEIGLDYYYNNSPREVQLEWFERQLDLALRLGKPVIIHDREAHQDTMRILKKYRPNGVVHCFSGSVEMAREVLELGMYISLGGAVTFKNAKKPVEVAAMLPEDRLVLETDAPYMTPVPFRGKRCHSGHIAYTAQKIAEIRGISVDKLLEKTCENACRLFGITL